MDNAITSSFAFEGGVSNNLLVMGRTVIFMMKLRWQPKKNLYIFIDEGGDMVFSEKGTRYFTLTALTKTRPFTTHQTLTELKYDLWEKNIDFEYFHATEDTQATRNEVFNVISKNINQFTVDSVIVEKRKTQPSLQKSSNFYKKIFEILLNYVLERHKGKFQNVYVITDTIPINKHRKNIEKAIKGFFKPWQNINKATTYKIFHYSSKSDINLQITDYFNWAIFRKWERCDHRSYDLIKRAIFSEFDVFEIGEEFFY